MQIRYASNNLNKNYFQTAVQMDYKNNFLPIFRKFITSVEISFILGFKNIFEYLTIYGRFPYR